VGKYLERVGYPGSMQAAARNWLGKLAWAGNPQSIGLSDPAGDLTLMRRRDNFSIEPGVGKLLAYSACRPLPRRITLDFRDVSVRALLRYHHRHWSDARRRIADADFVCADRRRRWRCPEHRSRPGNAGRLKVAGGPSSATPVGGRPGVFATRSPGLDISGAAPVEGPAGPGLRLRICGDRPLDGPKVGESARPLPEGAAGETKWSRRGWPQRQALPSIIDRSDRKDIHG